jgi:predicted DNA-binding protein (MmcQ/YjbR family)
MPRQRASWRRYLLAKPGAQERFPFYPDLPVYFVGNKMFATLAEEGGICSMNLKCIPEWAVELRREHKAIIPGYHMNKRHWNTVTLDGSLPTSLVRKLVDCSFDLVKPKKKAKRP